MRKISVIICALNEEKTIDDVIKHVYQYPVVGQIVVVNDGSTDNTKEIIDELKDALGITVIHLNQNMGKGYAMAIGVENATFNIIAFVDADQREISDYLNHLLSPLLMNKCDMVLGYSTVNILNMEVNPLKILTGERAMHKKDLIPILEEMKITRFGVETLLYFYYLSMEKPVKFIHLNGLYHNDKYKKMPYHKATVSYINEAWEIAYTAIKHNDLLIKTLKQKVKKAMNI